jgi:predicted small lipoprotein YifL
VQSVRRSLKALAVLLTVSTVAACGSSAPSAPPASPDTVAVSAEGTRFDPPVEVADIPDGAWMCDMGTVHYAAAEKGDGTCPVCSMKLTRKSATTH